MTLYDPSDQRALATWLAGLDDARLATLFAEREVAPSAAWHDFFDAAESIQDAAALGHALAALPRPDADALVSAVRDGSAVARPALDALAERGLVGADGRVPDAVAVLLEGREPVGPAPSPATAAAAGESAEAAAAERAFTATAVLADLLTVAWETPLARVGSGALGAAERRRLEAAGIVGTGDDPDLLLDIADIAGLVAGADRAWWLTDAGVDWLDASTLDRWCRVAEALIGALPPAVRDGAGWIGFPLWYDAYPLDESWPDRADTWWARLAAWGLLAERDAEPTWTAALRTTGAIDTAALERLLPPEVDRVFVQNDLTAISPGPLAPRLDLRLRRMAHRESRAQASTYRFTPATISAALSAGETAESMTRFLTELSLTGVPQPLAYTIERAAQRHGVVRVGRDASSSRTILRSEDATALETIAVDQSLRSLGLVPDGATLVSRSSVDTVFWMLRDAGYPAIAVDDTGAARVLERRRTAAAATEPTPLERYGALIARLREAHGGDADAAWLGRELDLAVRSRSVVTVVVQLPDGATRDFTLEVTGLGGGRLRGRDRGAGVERTLPVSSILRVAPGG